MNRFRRLVGRSATHDLHRILRSVHGRSVENTVQAVVDLVVETAGFQVAAVSVERAGDLMETVAVAGSTEALHQLLHRRQPRSVYEDEFAVADHWGALLFVPHDRVPGAADRGWIPPLGANHRSKKAWHPLDALYAPLRTPRGELIGVLSVDLPRRGVRPRRRQRELLEILAAQAGIAIDNACLAEQLRAGEEILRLAFDGAGIGMALISLAAHDYGRYLMANPTFCAIVGRSREEILTLTADEIMHPDNYREDDQQISELLAGRQPVYQTEKRYVRDDGESVWVAVTVTLVRLDDGSVRYAIGQAEDITERRRQQLELHHRAHFDTLTELPNRAAVLARLQQAMTRAAETGREGAFLFVDLDDFKRVNDAHGHIVGDHVLATIATRLADGVRPGDMAARWGGDEFLVIADALAPDGAAALAHRLAAGIAVPIAAQGIPAQIVTASIGITPIPIAHTEVASLLQQADRAMYAVKNQT